MKKRATKFSDVFILEPQVFTDARGLFFESYNAEKFCALLGVAPNFVQDNLSRSVKGTLRGLHYQIRQPQGKLVHVLKGRVYDVIVDLRKPSPTFGQWMGVELSEDNRLQLWIPPGFAHGFVVLSDLAEFFYKATDFYAPQHERRVIWNDPCIGIEWPIDFEPVLSAKDANGVSLAQAELFES